MVNKVILLGNLGKDPVVRRFESGAAVATFSLATSENYKDKEGNKQTKTEWHNIVLWNWRGLADVAEKFLKKGDKVYIEGKITSRSYEQEGVTKYLTEIVGENMTLLSPKPTTGGSYNAPPPEEPPYREKTTTPIMNNNDSSDSPLVEPDDLPF